MTCIIGIVENGEVWMGGDSLSRQFDIDRTQRAPKFVRRGEMLMGAAGDAALTDLLEFALSLPDCPAGCDARAYIVCDFIPAVRMCLKEAGRLKTRDGAEEMDGSILVALRGRLFNIGGTFDADEATDNFEVVGCGAPVAIGALFALNMPNAGKLPAEVRLRIALEASGRFSDGCSPPFHIEKL